MRKKVTEETESEDKIKTSKAEQPKQNEERKIIASSTQKDVCPVKISGQSIFIQSDEFSEWMKQNQSSNVYEARYVIHLRSTEPMITLFEDLIKVREYHLQTEGDEDFSGKYFHVSVRLAMHGEPTTPIAQIDGFVSDTAEDHKMTFDDIGYCMEVYFLACGGDNARKRYEMIRGQDLQMKALRYPGYVIPNNVRLLGICPKCGKSFAFHGYSFHHMQTDIAYSDDGLDLCEIREYPIDKKTWSYTTEGKTFRYYNSFNCPNCKEPYIDYAKYPELKVFGVLGCVHLDRETYHSGRI